MRAIILVFYVGMLSNAVYGQTCVDKITLHAEEKNVQDFVSHTFYETVDYNSDQHKCWLIYAPEGQRVFLDVYYELQDHCTAATRDRIKIHDGETWDDNLDYVLCGDGSLRDYHTSDSAVYIEFISDQTVEDKGFKVNYWSEHVEEDGDVGAIIGIVFGCILGLALIIGIIVICCVCCNQSSKGKVHSTNPAQTTGYQTSTQAYPTQQYSNHTYAGGAVVMQSGQAVYTTSKAPPAPTMAQSHPVDERGVPFPAIYKEP